MRPASILALLCACGGLDVAPRGPLDHHDLLYTSVESSYIGETGNDELHLLQPDGHVEVLVSREPDRRIAEATWSPDGTTLVYAASVFDPRSGGLRYQLERVEPGGLPRVLAALGGQDVSGPRFSPDGRHVLAAVTVPPPDDRVRHASLRVLLISSTGGDGRLISPPDTDAAAPRWSRDGRFVFYARTDRNRLWTALWRMDLEAAEPVHERIVDEPLYSYAVSPRADRLVVSTLTRTFTTDLAGGDVQKIDEGWGVNLVYSPGGDLLAFLLNGQQGSQLAVLPVAGGEKRPIHPVDGGFSWSPDGGWIAVGWDGAIDVVPIAGGRDPIRTTASGRHDRDPVWRPAP